MLFQANQDKKKISEMIREIQIQVGIRYHFKKWWLRKAILVLLSWIKKPLLLGYARKYLQVK